MGKYVTCDKEECQEEPEMSVVEEDSRQEWYRAVYECNKGHKKESYVTFDQNGIVLSDELTEVK